MDRSSFIFCAASVIVCLGLAWIAYPLAALDEETIAQANTAQPAELMPMIDVGGGFGELPATELMDYYIENPPAPPEAGAAAAPEIKFGGC
ncbi:hypothetical protein [Maritimibacter sp. HL-12]|jgi:hypothetical protein|uniref:hypothetical protein n=1 Tax=Maritimibacter sp. HL-12 TaxID=1162418 RepID=UPI000A0F2B61|nr:hypothetical protein [Maritimibacter sp. HL-12]SMH45633.1 hypothetical protein SAMN05661107_1627 [Maritimibacter sp. HL-12]